MDARSAALSTLARFQVTETTAVEALQRIADITLEAVTAADVVGMTMLGDDGRPTTAIYTNPDSPEVDEAQYREGKGPCLDAWRERKVFRLARVDDCGDKYPGFVAACAEHGLRSTLSLPMAAGDVSLGAMNLYSRVYDAFADDDVRSLCMDLAAAGSVVLANVSAYWTAFDMSQQLSEAMKSRAVIEQAKGMLMAQTPGVTADDAFELLRRASQRENVKLREIAARIVGRRASAELEAGEDRN